MSVTVTASPASIYSCLITSWFVCVCVCEGGIGSRKRLFSSFIILGGNEVRMILSQKKRLASAWSRHGCGRCCPGLWNILLSISISSRLPFHSLVLNIFLQSSPLYACTSINVFPCNQGFYRRLKEKQRKTMWTALWHERPHADLFPNPGSFSRVREPHYS